MSIEINRTWFKLFVLFNLSLQIIKIIFFDYDNLNLIFNNYNTLIYGILIVFLIYISKSYHKLAFFFFVIACTTVPIDIKYFIQGILSKHIEGLLVKQILSVCFTIVLIGVLFFFINTNKRIITFTVFLSFYLLTTNISSIFNYRKFEQRKIEFQKVKLNKNLYVLLFDEYPSQTIMSKYFNYSSQFLKNIITDFQFDESINAKSNYLNTEMSIPSFLYGDITNKYRVSDAINSFNHNRFTDYNNFEGYSIFNNQFNKNAITNSVFITSFNTLATRYIIPYIISIFNKQGSGIFFDFDSYHKNALLFLQEQSEAKTIKSKVVFVHFFTPHDRLFKSDPNFVKRVEEANTYMKRSIEIINQNDQTSSIIIMADHGYRNKTISLLDQYKILFLYKNINIDTVELSRNGIYTILNN